MKQLALANLSLLGLVTTGVALLAVLLHLQERAVSRYVSHRLGWRGVLLTGWLGVPLHELGHLTLAKLFGHRIIAWKLFDPDPASGTLGYVRHARARHDLWQRLGDPLIALAPLLAGGLALAGLLLWMLPADRLGPLWRQALALGDGPSTGQVIAALSRAGDLVASLAGALWAGRSALTPLQLYLCVAVACHMAPSRADLASAAPALLCLLLVLAATAVGAAALGVSVAPVTTAVPLAAAALVIGGLFQLAYVGAVALLTARTTRRGVGGSLSADSR